MLLTTCKSCQYCLETMYWKCCEERFCFDKKIATYKLDDSGSVFNNGYTNMAASFDSVVTEQPTNNNHLPHNAIVSRQVNELPVNADKIYEVFSKSMIFRDEFELKSKSSNDSLDDLETKSEPDLSDRPNRTKVYFEDEINSPITDFEIMFNDELLSKIQEEEESEENSQDTEEGLVMNVEVRKQNVVKPTTVTIKDETKITTSTPIFEYDPNIAVPSIPSTISLPRVESLKSILRQNRNLSRSISAKALTRVDSKPTVTKLDIAKPLEPEKINKLLARVPKRSVSYLNIPEHLQPERPPLTKSKSTIGVSLLEETDRKQISHLPDTPIIRSANLPRFFTESPTNMEYKRETSLQSIKEKSSMTFKENDFSMPRYGHIPTPFDAVPVHESKSMPDLRIPGTSSGKVSKRLVRIRSKLKPLVIKKGTDEIL